VCLQFDATMDPTYHELEPMAIHTKGREVYERRHGAKIPFHLSDHATRSTNASYEFELAFGREPDAGDMLRCYHVGRIVHNPEISSVQFDRLFETWRRQLPRVICPLKFEKDQLFKRLKSGDWEEDVTIGAQAKWWGVECDVFSRDFDGLGTLSGGNDCREVDPRRPVPDRPCGRCFDTLPPSNPSRDLLQNGSNSCGKT
jgi:hypothetical protein